MTTIRMTGHDAIRYAAAHSLTLSTYTDPTAEARDGVSVEEARSIAREDPSLVYLDVAIDPDRITADQARALPNHGVTHAVDLTWHRRDTGREWLVVERGNTQAPGAPYVDLYSRHGVIVATEDTEAAAAATARQLKAAANKRHLISTLYTVVRRDSVVVMESAEAYGTTAGEASR